VHDSPSAPSTLPNPRKFQVPDATVHSPLGVSAALMRVVDLLGAARRPRLGVGGWVWVLACGMVTAQGSVRFGWRQAGQEEQWRVASGGWGARDEERPKNRSEDRLLQEQEKSRNSKIENRATQERTASEGGPCKNEEKGKARRPYAQKRRAATTKTRGRRKAAATEAREKTKLENRKSGNPRAHPHNPRVGHPKRVGRSSVSNDRPKHGCTTISLYIIYLFSYNIGCSWTPLPVRFTRHGSGRSERAAPAL